MVNGSLEAVRPCKIELMDAAKFTLVSGSLEAVRPSKIDLLGAAKFSGSPEAIKPSCPVLVVRGPLSWLNHSPPG